MEGRGHEALSIEALAAALPITPREAEVLACIASGMTNTQVGRQLAISVQTVVKHLEHLYRKLGVTNRVAATALAFRSVGIGDAPGGARPVSGKTSDDQGLLGDRRDETLSIEALAAALPITPREAEVLAYIASGMTNAQVGRQLAISVRTVVKHLEHLYRKLGVTNRVAATALAFRSVGMGDDRGGADGPDGGDA